MYPVRRFLYVSLYYLLLIQWMIILILYVFSIKLISYWDKPLMEKFLVWYIQLRHMTENVQPNTSFCQSIISTPCDLLSPCTITSVCSSHFVSFVILSIY
jgi:hypothetical protein